MNAARTLQDDPSKILGGWLADRLDHPEGFRLVSIDSPDANGFSALTYFVCVEWAGAHETNQRTYVIRQQSMSEDALFPDQDFLGLAEVQRVIGKVNELPVPEVLWIEREPDILGSPFFAMPLVAGRVPSDNPPLTIAGWTTEASDAEREQMTRSAFKFMGQLFALDPDHLGIASSLSRSSENGLEIAGDLAYYNRFMDWASEGDVPAIAHEASQWLHDNCPASERRGISWGDARYGNIIFEGFELKAALDWEMATLGDPAKDVGFFSYLNRFFSQGIGVPLPGGFPVGKDASNLFTECTQIELPEFAYYEVFAAYRSLTIFVRHWHLLMRRGEETGGATPSQNPPATILADLIG